jgi:DNA-binding NarL/FixJ family response regulator
MINVMIVDNHKMVREGIKNLIEFDKSIKVVDESCDGNECISKIRNSHDVILLDINMPIMNGIETLKIITKRKKRPKILMLTVHNEIDYLIEAIDIGADGYILKDSDSKELIRAIHTVARGEKFFQPDMIPLLNSKLIARDIEKEKINSLSDREMDVLKLVAVGNLNKEVAKILDISERTVKNHLSTIYRKIDCTDRTEAAVFCIKNGLITVD